MKWRTVVVVVVVLVVASILTLALVGCGGFEAFGLLQEVGR